MNKTRIPTPAISLGNMLESVPVRPPTPADIDAVVGAGFRTVRLPVRWSAHIDPRTGAVRREFSELVSTTVDALLARGVHVVLNVHHFHELFEEPARHGDDLVTLWNHIAANFADRPESLVFELLNEPRQPMTAADWNALLPRVLAEVRRHDRRRVVLVGPAEANTLEGLPDLRLPDDEHLALTVHYYSPFPFTHQGASWVPGSRSWLGTSWGDPGDRAAVTRDLEAVADWAADHDLPVFVGEFGCHDTVDMNSRATWTAWVRTEADRLGLSWAYWDFDTDFGAFDPSTRQWHPPLLRAIDGAPHTANGPNAIDQPRIDNATRRRH